MASAAADDPKPLKKSSSFPFLPPYMSELRVVLLGNSWSQRSSVGNFILEKTEFSTKEEPDCCQSVTSWLKEKKIVLINTPDLLQPKISLQELTVHVENCVRLSAPGPHVFLLVLQPEDFTEEHKLKLCRVLQRFSDQTFDHSLVLISTLREESSAYTEKYQQHPPLKDLIKMCRYRNLKLKNLERSELLTRLGQTAKENNGDHVSRDESEDEDAGLSMTLKFESEHIKAALNLVLCGRRGAEKTSAAEAILGQKELHSVSNSSECVKHQGEVCGRRVSLVELPALYGKPQEEVMEESLRCISLCDPEGVHAFILVLPVGSITDEDKGELEIIQNTFSSRVDDFTMILFTVDSDPTASAVVDFVKGNKKIEELRQSCGGRYFVLNIKDKQQIPELLEAVEKVTVEGSRCLTKDMFTKAQMEKVWKLKQRSDDGSQSLIQEQLETILKEKEEEMKRKEEELKRKHEEDLKELNRKLNEQRRETEQERKLKAKQLMEKDECINKERRERKREREEEEKKWKKLLEASEKIFQSEKTQRENAEKKLELCRKEMKRDRDAWDKERKDLWERIRQEDKQRLEEEKTSHRKLQEEFQRKRRKWTYSLFVLSLLLLLFLSYYVFLSYAYTTDSTNTREHT